MELFVEAGLTNFEALRTATINPVKFLGMSDSLGTIEEGKLADLVILDQNPVERISATQSIIGVIVNGEFLSTEKINKIKEQLVVNKIDN